MKSKSFLILLLAATLIVGVTGCSKKESTKDYKVVEGFGPEDRYFSLNQFVLDQYATLHGLPIVLSKVSTIDGQSDSAFLPIEKIAWAKVFEAVREADISDRSHLGKYNYTQFMDSSNGRLNIIYEAQESKQQMRKMLMVVDPYENNKINSVFVQFQKDDVARWMYYEPQQYLRFLEEKKDSKPNNTKLEYFFH